MPNVVADRSRRRRGRLIASIVATIVAVDQVTKAWAVAKLSEHPVSILGVDVELRLSFNSGGAFSVLRDATPVLAVLAMVMVVVLVRVLRRSTDQWLLVALAIGLGGVLGNLIDRLVRAPGLLRGEVVDFVKVWSWPTFNMADAAITVAAVMLVIGLALGTRAHHEANEPR